MTKADIVSKISDKIGHRKNRCIISTVEAFMTEGKGCVGEVGTTFI